MDIRQILESKPHNTHYINRYIKFIDWCTKTNVNLLHDDYTENHHICPKAKDLFPEYTDFNKLHEWNKIPLTPRQHIQSHVLLWKAYGGSQTIAIDNLLGLGNVEHFTDNWFPTSAYIRLISKIKEDRYNESIGRAMYALPNGEYYGRLHKSDPLIIELGLSFYSSDAQRENGRRLSEIGHLALLGTTKYTNGVDEKMVKEHPGEGWVEGRSPRSKEQKDTHQKAVLASFEGKKVYNDGARNYFLFDHEVTSNHYDGMKHKETNYYYINQEKTEILTFFGAHTVPIGYFRIKEREAIRAATKINDLNRNIATIEDAKEFIRYCLRSKHYLNPNKSMIFNHHIVKLREILNLSENTPYYEIIKFVMK